MCRHVTDTDPAAPASSSLAKKRLVRPETKFLANALPLPPVCQLNADQLLLVFRLDPATEDASARKRQRVWFVVVYDGKFKFAVKRRG
jgi:hypothetical protein